ncbi:MAG: phytanoyl-CoA dioxygenase family protein [Planctomycetota bacterium]
MTASALPFLALRHQIVLPGQKATIHACRPSTKALLQRVLGDSPEGVELGVFPQKDPAVEYPSAGDLWTVGCLVRVLSAQKHGDIGWALEVEGVRRLRMVGRQDETSAIAESIEGSDAAEAFAAIRAEASILAFDELCSLSQAPADEVAVARQALDRRLDEIDAGRREVQPFPDFEQLREVWPLRDGGDAEIERRLAANSITAQEAADLLHFREHGWVLWEGLLDDSLVDRFLADLAAIKDRPGEFLLTDHRRQRPYRISGADFDHFENIYDSYVLLESSRRVCYHPRVKRFLELVFDADPIATQQLLFQRSNQHMLHQDTAFVCVDESLQLLATWIALEDVVAGRGELTYYDKSHRIEPFRFGDGSRRFAGGGHDANDVADELQRRSEAAGCEKVDFLAKKGDVFFWAADLVHGSNERTADPELTRRSCVTHYCPDWTRPTFMRGLPDFRGTEDFPEGKISSTYYRLPTSDQPVRPVPQMPEPC